MTVDDGESGNPDHPEKRTWFRAFTASAASWSVTCRVGFLILVLMIPLVTIGLLGLDVTIGPVEIGSP